MCLYIKEDTKFKIAEEDIPCWKLLEFCYDCFHNKYVCYTPYAHFPVINHNIEADNNIKYDSKTSITLGVIHCYINEKDAKQTTLYHLPNTFLFKAIIPKGTKYIEGSDKKNSYYNNNYGAKCIKIIDSRFIKWMKTNKLLQFYTEIKI